MLKSGALGALRRTFMMGSYSIAIVLLPFVSPDKHRGHKVTENQRIVAVSGLHA